MATEGIKLGNGFHSFVNPHLEVDRGLPCKTLREEVKPKAEIPPKRTVTVADILDCLLESKKVVEIVDQLFIKIHTGKNLEKVAGLYKQVVLDNQDQLDAYPAEQKVQIFFALYKKLLIPVVEKHPAYSTFLSEMQAQFPQEKNFLEATRKLVDKEIRLWQASFVRKAIVGVDLKVALRDETSPAHEKIVEILTLSQDAQRLFENLLDS